MKQNTSALWETERADVGAVWLEAANLSSRLEAYHAEEVMQLNLARTNIQQQV